MPLHVPADGGFGQSVACVATVHAFVQNITDIIRKALHMFDAQLPSAVHDAPKAPPPSVVLESPALEESPPLFESPAVLESPALDESF